MDNERTISMAIDLNKLQALFLDAVEVSDAAERAALLDRACAGDAELRGRVESLLAAHESPGSLLDEPLIRHGDPTSYLVPEAAAGALIAARYKLLEQIGEGGMGLVWMAEQRAPVRRLVAIKLIKAGMDSRAVLARFEAERQALAMMDHPSIARVFDGGVTEHGHPWFAMELVRGLAVTDYCDQRRMPVADRLELFMQICSAVQHAHQKGIIHRDLKPSNVLVTEHDGRPLPKIIDFGLAKALGGGTLLTEHTLYTSFGTAAGTPLYMAPEQVAINALDVDTRADVYALGVLLYELLTGTTPLERQRVKDAAWDELRRAIREEEPLRPSMRISSSAALPNLAATRQIEPAKLSGLVRGDLDWIVLKALEKDRNRRYESASGLAADVGRHLANEPVVAAPPTLSYRARKYVAKHRGAVIAATAVAAALVLGIIGTSVMTLQYRAATLREAAGRNTAEMEAYVANLSSAQTALATSNFPEARRRLDACAPAQRGWEWRFLRETAGAVKLQLPGQVILSPDASRIVSALPDGTIQFWNDAGDALTPPQLAGNGHVEMKFISEGTRLVTVAGGVLKLWDCDGHLLCDAIPVASKYGVAHLSDKEDLLLSFSDEGVVRLWDVNGRAVGAPMKAGEKCNSAYFDLNDSRVVTISGNTVRSWNTKGEPVGTAIMVTGGDIDEVIISPDGSRLVTAASAGKVTKRALWSSSGQHLADFPDVFSNAMSGYFCEFSRNGERLAVESLGHIQLYDRDGRTVGHPLPLPSQTPSDDSYLLWEFSPDGSRLATDAGQLWDLDGNELGKIDLEDSPLESIKFSDDGKIVAFTFTNGDIQILNAQGRRLHEIVRHEGHKIDSYEFVPESNALAVFSGGTMRLWSAEGEPLSDAARAGSGEYWVAADFNLDRKQFVTRASHRRFDEFCYGIRVWNFDGSPVSALITARTTTHSSGSYGKPDDRWSRLVVPGEDCLRMYDLAGEPVGMAMKGRHDTISPGGNLLYTMRDGACQLWDLQGRRIGERLPESDEVLFNSDETICLLRRRNRLQLCNPQGQRLGAIVPNIGRGKSDWDRTFRFSRDGTHLIVCDDNSAGEVPSSAIVVRADTFGQPLDVFDRFEGGEYRDYIVALALNESAPQSRREAHFRIRQVSGGQLEVIDRTSGVTLARIGYEDAPIATYAVSHDGSRLVVGDAQRTIRFFDTASWRELAMFHVDSNASKLEFTPADTRLIVSLVDGRVEIWDSREYAARQADRDAQWAERQSTHPWAERYVNQLVSSPAKDDPAAFLANDSALSPTQRYVAGEILQNRLDDVDAAREWDEMVAVAREFASANANGNSEIESSAPPEVLHED